MKNDPVDMASASLLVVPHASSTSSSQDRFDVVRRLKAPIWVFDIDQSCIVFANEPALTMWQAKNEKELCSRDLSQNMSSTVKRRLKQYQIDFIERDASFTEQWTLYPNDEPVSVLVVYRGVVLNDGRMGMQCEVVDQAKNEPDNIRSAEALLHTDVMITLYSIDGVPLYMNPAARNAAINSRHVFADIFEDNQEYENAMQAVHKYGEYRLVSKVFTNKGLRWYDISVKRCADAVTGKPAALVTAMDVSERKVAKDKARYLADRDQLTGCFNRAYVQQYFENLASAQIRECALLYFDIDKFKKINDVFGHEMGDAVLKQLAERTRNRIRSDDLIARLGGDEFVVFLHGVAQKQDLEVIIDDLQSAFAEPIRHASTLVNVTVSIGVRAFDAQKTEFDTALRDADVALYSSKQEGRDRATFFNDDMGTAAKQQGLLEADIRRGIAAKEFVLHYQPRIDVCSGRTVSVEALVRWEHPVEGLILPDKFIPICEKTGMIEELGRYIVEMGCEQAMEWGRAGVDLCVSINISPRQFQGTHLMAVLEKFAMLPDFSHQKIELEITENVLIGDDDLIVEKLQAIANLGYRIALDDFGTGYSNLSYISRFPLNCIKIDRLFISQLPSSGPIVQLILTLAKQLNVTSVAEGIESQSEYDWLREKKCDQVQGFLFSKPVPLKELNLFK